MPWSTPFPDPIQLPDGGKLHTLHDAAKYIQSLPKAVHDLPHWQHAVEHLLRASGDSVDADAWLMFAQMFMLRALHHGRVEVKEPRRKVVKSYKVIQ